MNETWQFKLLYDGECPMCRREVNWLRQRCRDGRLVFEDISAAGFDAARFGATQEQLMGFMHGVFPDGRMLTKVDAFREAYRLVGLGWLLVPTGWPGLRRLADWGYEQFARNRLKIGKLFGGRGCLDDRCAAGTAKR